MVSENWFTKITVELFIVVMSGEGLSKNQSFKTEILYLLEKNSLTEY